jgi:transcription elongation GreA/GreB family factor
MIVLKQKLFNVCVDFVNKREHTVTEIISSNQKALTSETKSSAGDKHETGRAMLQLEMEKASQQLEGIYTIKTILTKVNLDDNSEFIKLGSLIITNQANYFLAISVGEIKIENKVYYAISPSSPIGSLLLGKRVGEGFIFNGNSIVIDEVC